MVVHRLRGAEHRHHRVTDELHHRAGTGQHGLVHGRPVLVELPGQCGRIGALGDGRVAPDVRHQHRDLQGVGLARSAAGPDQLLGDATGEEAGQLLALLLAVGDGPVQGSQSLDGGGLTLVQALGQLDEEPLDLGIDRGRRRLAGHCNGLHRHPLSDRDQQRFLRGVERPSSLDRLGQRLHDLGVEHRSAGRHLPDGPGQLVALGDPVLQQVGHPRGPLGQQGHRICRVVELGQDDHAGPGVSPADLGRRLDPLPGEVGRHPDVGHDHLGDRLGRPGHQLVTIGGLADDLQITGELDQRLDPLPDQEVVVGQVDGDGHRPLPSRPIRPRRRPATGRFAGRT